MCLSRPPILRLAFVNLRLHYVTRYKGLRCKRRLGLNWPDYGCTAMVAARPLRIWSASGVVSGAEFQHRLRQDDDTNYTERGTRVCGSNAINTALIITVLKAEHQDPCNPCHHT